MAKKKKKDNRNREPTLQNTKKKTDRPVESTTYQMMTTWGEHFYQWNGNLYDSDIVRACIRPKVKAVGKLIGKHIRGEGTDMKINPSPWIRSLLERPNPYMTAQQFQEKMAANLALTNNAFALIVRNEETGTPMQLYPIEPISVTAVDDNGKWFIEFTHKNGSISCFKYEDLIHLKDDFYGNQIFGVNPAPALASLMECVGTIDQGIVKAVKNSGVIKWLLKYTQPLRPEDLKRNVKEFVDNYLDVESETFGAAGIDTKADAKQIEPKDYVPNAAVTDRLVKRTYSFFGVNESIVTSDYTEDQWNAFYESQVEPVAIQFSEAVSMRLFTRREAAAGNRIIYESFNLTCASTKTKLELVAFVDRGIMSPNEVRLVLNLPPIPGGDEYIRRLDTQPIDTATEGGDGNEG